MVVQVDGAVLGEDCYGSVFVKQTPSASLFGTNIAFVQLLQMNCSRSFSLANGLDELSNHPAAGFSQPFPSTDGIMWQSFW